MGFGAIGPGRATASASFLRFLAYSREGLLTTLSRSSRRRSTASGFAPTPEIRRKRPNIWAGLETGFSTSSTWASDEAESGKAGRLSDYLTNRSVFGCSIDCRVPRPGGGYHGVRTARPLTSF